MSSYVDFTVEFSPRNEPRILASRIDEFSEAIDDFTDLLVASRQIITEDIHEHFEQEQGPEGSWAPWSPSYAPRAQSENIGILRKSEDLHDAATSSGAYPIVGNDLFVDTGDFPEYWRVHQQGGLISSARNIVKRRRMGINKVKGASDFGRIPARPYLYRSPEADVQIGILFDEWFEQRMMIYIKPSGHAQRRLPAGSPGGTGGQFGRGVGLHP